jgi:hypothetical protein
MADCIAVRSKRRATVDHPLVEQAVGPDGGNAYLTFPSSSVWVLAPFHAPWPLLNFALAPF